MSKNNIILIGMPGSGKSTLGVVLAKKIGYSFIDSDIVIQDTYKKTLEQLIGTVIYLKVSEKELESRLGSLKERGVVSNGKSTVEEIFEDRKRLYEKYADITIVQEGRDIRMIVEDMYKKLTKLI